MLSLGRDALWRGVHLSAVGLSAGPQSPDFRHALAQLIDYGSDLLRPYLYVQRTYTTAATDSPHARPSPPKTSRRP